MIDKITKETIIEIQTGRLKLPDLTQTEQLIIQ